MNLKYFKDIAYDSLLLNINKNTDFYTNETAKLDDLFGENVYYEESGLSANLPSLDIKNDMSTAEKNEQDIVNTRLIYDSLNFLTPMVATNLQLWTYLCHSKYKAYTISRWIKNPEEEDKNEKLVTTIKERFFATSTPQKNIIRMNAISRLWWAGYLTYDSGYADPYHLTKILFTGQQICADILDTPFCGNKKIITGILLGIKQYTEDNNISVNANTVRACIKYLRRYAAVTSIDFIEKEEIQNITYNFLISN